MLRRVRLLATAAPVLAWMPPASGIATADPRTSRFLMTATAKPLITQDKAQNGLRGGEQRIRNVRPAPHSHPVEHDARRVGVSRREYAVW